jgi:membrane protein implicated in regulation of membrane protease activity
VIFEKTLMTLAAAAAIAAAAAVAVVSAAFAIYAVLVPLVTAAGAAAIVSAVAALIVAIAGMIAARKVEGRHHHHGQQAPPQSFDMTGKIVEIVRDKSADVDRHRSGRGDLRPEEPDLDRLAGQGLPGPEATATLIVRL